MRIFLVDTENVGWGGLKGIQHLEKTDEVYMFTTDLFNSTKLPALDAVKALSSKAKIQNIYIGSTNTIKNYLDFQLCTFLGSIMEHYPKAEAIIISNDRGYISVVNFWKFRSRKISLSPNIETYLEMKDKLPRFEPSLQGNSEEDVLSFSSELNVFECDENFIFTAKKGSVDVTKRNSEAIPCAKDNSVQKLIPDLIGTTVDGQEVVYNADTQEIVVAPKPCLDKTIKENIALFRMDEKDIEKKEAPAKYKKHINRVIKKHYPEFTIGEMNKHTNKIKEIKNLDKLKKCCTTLFNEKADIIYKEILEKYPYNEEY